MREGEGEKDEDNKEENNDVKTGMGRDEENQRAEER